MSLYRIVLRSVVMSRKPWLNDRETRFARKQIVYRWDDPRPSKSLPASWELHINSMSKGCSHRSMLPMISFTDSPEQIRKLFTQGSACQFRLLQMWIVAVAFRLKRIERSPPEDTEDDEKQKEHI
jgi:hypothetical protein